MGSCGCGSAARRTPRPAAPPLLCQPPAAGCTTAWRNQDPKARHAPYHIHQQGSEAAHLANQGLIESRIKRLARIEAAHARGNQPHPSDARPHRRTLARRSRKHGTQTLTIRARQFITPIGRYTFTVTASITLDELHVDNAHRPAGYLPHRRALHLVR